MSEKQSQACCRDFCFCVKPTEKGIMICIESDDAEKAKAIKAATSCCDDAASKPDAQACSE